MRMTMIMEKNRNMMTRKRVRMVIRMSKATIVIVVCCRG